MKLTPAQQRALDAIKARGYATISSSHSWYNCAGQRFRHDLVEKLRQQHMLTGRTIQPGQPFPDGQVNELRVSVHIAVPTGVE